MKTDALRVPVTLGMVVEMSLEDGVKVADCEDEKVGEVEGCKSQLLWLWS